MFRDINCMTSERTRRDSLVTTGHLDAGTGENIAKDRRGDGSIREADRRVYFRN